MACQQTLAVYIYKQGIKCGSNAGSACFSSNWGAWPFHFINQKLLDFPGVSQEFFLSQELYTDFCDDATMSMEELEDVQILSF